MAAGTTESTESSRPGTGMVGYHPNAQCRDPWNAGSRLVVVPWKVAVKLIVGLGNPGRQYEQTRHNVGWMVLDRVSDRAGLGGRGKERDAAVVVRGRYLDQELVLAKPMTYMNESGIAVRKLLARERVPLSDLLIVYDDFDLPFGKLRMREAGSAGTHNGLRSIVAEMETQKIRTTSCRHRRAEPRSRRQEPRSVAIQPGRTGPARTPSSMRPPTRSRTGRRRVQRGPRTDGTPGPSRPTLRPKSRAMASSRSSPRRPNSSARMRRTASPEPRPGGESCCPRARLRSGRDDRGRARIARPARPRAPHR